MKHFTLWVRTFSLLIFHHSLYVTFERRFRYFPPSSSSSFICLALHPPTSLASFSLSPDYARLTILLSRCSNNFYLLTLHIQSPLAIFIWRLRHFSFTAQRELFFCFFFFCFSCTCTSVNPACCELLTRIDSHLSDGETVECITFLSSILLCLSWCPRSRRFLGHRQQLSYSILRTMAIQVFNVGCVRVSSGRHAHALHQDLLHHTWEPVLSIERATLPLLEWKLNSYIVCSYEHHSSAIEWTRRRQNS